MKKLWESLKKGLSLFVVMQMLLALVPIQVVTAANPDKMIICHSGSGTNYNAVSVGPSAVVPPGGHYKHDNDIIPPFFYLGTFYSGLNWDDAGKNIWLNSCGQSISEFDVVYDGNGYTSGTVPDDTNTYSLNELVTVLGQGTMVRSGYAFTGWNTQANGGGTSYAAGSTFNITGNIILYAQWVQSNLTVIYNGNGADSGTVPVDLNSPYLSGATVTVLGNTGVLGKTGYTFTDWNTAANGSGASYAPSATFTISANTILYAVWEVNQYDVSTSVTGNGSVSGGGTYNYGDEVTLTATPDTGWHFVDWSGDCTGTTNPFIFGSLDGDKSCTANFEINSYTLTFDSNGGTPVPSQTLHFGDLIVTPPDPTRAGFTFAGWSPVLPGTMPAGNLTVVAQWTPIILTIPPVAITPITTLLTTAPVAAAAGAVLGETAQAPEETPAAVTEEEPGVKGSSDEACPWWWIVALILIIAMAFVGGIVRSAKEESFWKKYYYLWPPILAIVAWIAHRILQDGLTATWFCNNYWLIMLILAVIGEFVFSSLVRNRKSDR